MEIFAPYAHALAALALMSLLVLILNPVAGILRARAGYEPGQTPPADYQDMLYRTCRAYENANRMLAMFAPAVLAAILTGAAPFWVNLFASVALLARLAVAFVHIKGIGATDNGPRTVLHVIGAAMAMCLAVLAFFAAF